MQQLKKKKNVYIYEHKKRFSLEILLAVFAFNNIYIRVRVVITLINYFLIDFPRSM